MTREYLPATERYVRSTSLAKRKQRGQYFTSATVVRALLGYVDLPEAAKLDILEPSCGTGEFLHVLQDYFPNARLTGVELEPKLALEAKKAAPRADIVIGDFFAQDFGRRRFDAIVGNPPFFQLRGDRAMRERYAAVATGRLNVFSAFVAECLGLLKKGGYLAFVIPPSMNNGAYFEGLRELIVASAEIEMLSVLDSDLFPGAEQMVMLLVLRKGPSTGRYVFTRGSTTIFSTDADYLTRAFVDRCSLWELGYYARTGSVVWNQHRPELSNTGGPGMVPLVWARNIAGHGRLELPVPGDGDKGQYIVKQRQEPLRGEAIVVNRITGKVQESALRASLVPEGTEFYAENHVNVILPRPDAEQLVTPKELVRQLNSRSVGRALNAVTGSTQLSCRELEWLLPLDPRDR